MGFLSTSTPATTPPGGADYTSLLPPNSFIDARNFQSPKGLHLSPPPPITSPPPDLAAYLYKVLQDPDIFQSYFAWRPHYDIYR